MMSKQPTLIDVAKAAGVSRSTAARAMSGDGYVDAGKKKLVEEAAIRLGYRGSAIARTLRTRRSHTIGILIADISNPLFPMIVKGADDVLSREGMTILLCNTEGDPAKQLAFVRNMLERHADGLILVSQSIRPEVTDLLRSGPPCVFINRTPDPDAFDYAGPDNRAGVRKLIEHLTGLGHRKIAFVAGPSSSSTALERIDAFRLYAPQFGAELRDDWILPIGYDYEAGRRGAAELLAGEDRPSAIIAANDFAALGVITKARELGLRVPEDLSVTGYDGSFREPIWEEIFPVGPRLTTVSQPRRQIGEAAAQLLLGRILDPEAPMERAILPVEFVAGNTTSLAMGLVDTS